ncbi:MAG: GNAT family N-acetyltransferase, partial [Erysipelotrichaceae bacterium]|nr:GNAT family N-acetyltransferase [Erysipelotrichaceae bacterium]
HLEQVIALSSHTDEDYLKTCIQEGMLGAFMDGKLVGIIGTHKERAMGLLEVLPEYHSHHIGYYLEAAMINACLLQDRVPFARISIDNTASLQMQERLGMVINEHIVQVLLP